MQFTLATVFADNLNTLYLLFCCLFQSSGALTVYVKETHLVCKNLVGDQTEP